MTQTMRISIAGVRLAFEIPQLLEAQFLDRYRAYLCTEEPELTFDLRFHDATPPPTTNSVSRGTMTGGLIQLSLGDVLLLVADQHTQRGWMSCFPPPERYPEGNTIAGLRTAIRGLTSMLLLQRGGCLIHACGISLGKRGLLCPGTSGTGKSTFSTAFEDKEVLNDDLVALLPAENGQTGFVLHSTPFWGFCRRPDHPQQVPLERMIRLSQAQTPSLGKVDPITRVRLLLATIATPKANPALEQRAFELAQKLATELHWIAVDFPKDGTGIRELLTIC